MEEQLNIFEWMNFKDSKEVQIEEDANKKDMTTQSFIENEIVSKQDLIISKEEKIKDTLIKYPHLVLVETTQGYYFKCSYNNNTFLELIKEFILNGVFQFESDIKNFIKYNSEKYSLTNLEKILKDSISFLREQRKECN